MLRVGASLCPFDQLIAAYATTMTSPDKRAEAPVYLSRPISDEQQQAAMHAYGRFIERNMVP